MKRLQLLCLALVAVFASVAAMSSAALAAELPENTPALKAGESRNWTGAAEGTSFFNSSSANVECLKATASGTETASKAPSGAFHIEFKECSAAGITCTGEGEGAGIILTLGTWALVFDREKTKEFKELTTAILFKVEPTKFKCSALVALEVKGEQLCLDLKPTEANTTHSFHCIASGEKQTEEWCKKDVSSKCEEPQVPVLLQSTNKAAFKESAELALGNDVYLVKLTGVI